MKQQNSIWKSSCKIYLLAMLSCMLINSGIRAQNIDLTQPCNNPDWPFPGQVAGQAISISPITSSPVGATMSIRTIDVTKDGFSTGEGCGTPCSSPITIHNISFTASGTSVTIAGAPDAASVGYEFRVTLRANDGTHSCDRIYVFNIIAPVDLMLVLDGSGSMAWGYDGNFSPPANQRRWDGLRTGVGVMATQLGGITLLSQDELGLRFFSTGVIPTPPPATPFNGTTLVSAQTNASHLTDPEVLPPDQPGGWTALGDGILAGRDMLGTGPSSNIKAMVVFSDGEQTIGHGEGPEVKETDPGSYTETTAGQSLSNSGKINIYTIGLGTSGSIPPTMQSIANKNGGQYLNADAGADFATFFTTQFTNIFSGRSPQLVDIKDSTFPIPSGGQPAVSTQSFSINKGVSSVIITLLAPTSTESRFVSIVKNGFELIQFAQQSSGPGSRTLTIKYPIKGLPDTVALAGDWTVKVQLGSRAPVAVPYTVMILADDHAIHSEYSLGAASFKVGDVVKPVVKFYRNGKPVTDATIKAVFAIPGDNVDDLIARARIDFTMPPVDSASPDVAKLAILMKDSNFVKKIRSQNHVVDLVYNAADSSYSASFNGLNVSGVYQVYYLTSATDSAFGKIQRYHQQSFYVRFPDIDLPNSNVIYSLDPQTGNTILTTRFITSQGKYLGSGWKSVIDVVGAGLKIDKIDDIGDGTYKIYFNGKLSGNGVVTILNDTIYNGSLTDIGKGGSGGTGSGNEIWKQWWFWVIIIIVIIIIWLIARKKKGP